MTHITPSNYAAYRGYAVVLTHPSKPLEITGTLLGMSVKGTKVQLDDGTVTTRRGWTVTAKMMSAVEVAEFFGIKPTALRYQLRNHGARVGKGGRYGFDPVDVATIAQWLE